MKKILFISILIICTSLQAQIVNIPDPNFKNALVNTPCIIFGPPGDCGDVNASIDINGDGEVQFAEAEGVDFLCIGYQDITSLEGIEAFVNLEQLYVYNNDLTTIDTSHNLLLKILDCSGNNLNSINISQNIALEVLNLQGNQLTNIDISGNSSLTSLNCRNNQLSGIDISNNTNLIAISLGYNEFTSIDLTGHPNFKGLSIQNNYLTTINVSQNPVLTSLNISNNNLSHIDLSKNPLLGNLIIHDNNLSIIDVSHNPLLENLFIGGNIISSFDVSNNLLLETLSFSESLLITGNIDLSQHSVLWALRCENTSISGLNIKNGDPMLPSQLKASNNPNLFCIDVDDAEAANAGLTNPFNLWEVDEQVYFSENCNLGTEFVLENLISVYPNPTKNILMVYNQSKIIINTIKVYDTLGKLVLEQKKSTNHIDISNIANGLLFIKIETDDGILIKKIIKE